MFALVFFGFDDDDDAAAVFSSLCCAAAAAAAAAATAYQQRMEASGQEGGWVFTKATGVTYIEGVVCMYSVNQERGLANTHGLGSVR